MTVIDREEFTPTGGTISKVVELHDDGRVVTTADGKSTTTAATPATIARAAAIVAARANENDDSNAEDFIRARIPGAVTKAKQIMAAPGAGTPTWTAAETRVILAALVLDLAARRTR